MIKVAGIQIAPIFLDAQKTWEKLAQYIREAKSNGTELVTWGETLIPGYPIWLARSGGAKFNDRSSRFIQMSHLWTCMPIFPLGTTFLLH